MITQEELIKWLRSQKLQHAKKFGEFKFRLCITPEAIVTVIDGVQETTNQANIGDYIVTGPKGEEFAISPDQFKSRYRIADDHGTAGIAEAIGECWCVVSNEAFEFTAPWGEKMVCEIGDYLCSPNPEITEVYRIESSIFHQTYKIS